MELDLRMSRATDSAARAGSAITIEARVESVDWVNVHADLDAQGWAIAPKLLSGAEADFLSGLYHQEHCFRSRIIMSRHSLSTLILALIQIIYSEIFLLREWVIIF